MLCVGAKQHQSYAADGDDFFFFGICTLCCIGRGSPILASRGIFVKVNLTPLGFFFDVALLKFCQYDAPLYKRQPEVGVTMVGQV